MIIQMYWISKLGLNQPGYDLVSARDKMAHKGERDKIA